VSSTAAMHECPAPGCETLVSNDRLACRAHWYTIPQPLRSRLWNTWASGDGWGSPAHAEAVDACIRFLEERAA